MRKQFYTITVIIIMCGVILSNATAAEYVMTNLGLGGASKINNNGVVVKSGEIWDNGTVTTIGTLDEKLRFARDINNSGQVAGFLLVSNPAPVYGSDAFSYEDGSINYIYTGTNIENYATGINEGGIIVGWNREPSTGGYARAFYYDGTMHNLGTINNVTWESYARNINDNNIVVGFSYITQPGTGNTDYHAFYCDISDGVLHDMGILGTSGRSIAYEINNNNQIVGYSEITPGGAHNAFIYEIGGSMINLGTLSGGTSYANDINNNGVVVGNSDGFAFIWDETNGMRNLNDLISAGSGWTLTSANGINDAGQIVGTASYEGQIYGFLLDYSPTSAVPEPLTCILLALSSIAIYFNKLRA